MATKPGSARRGYVYRPDNDRGLVAFSHGLGAGHGSYDTLYTDVVGHQLVPSGRLDASTGTHDG